MTSDELDDQLLRALHDLPVLTSEDVRRERVRVRCHAAIARHHLRAERSASRARFVMRALEPALVAGFGLMYLAGLFYDVLRFEGIL
jgi:hypothetical protein